MKATLLLLLLVLLAAVGANSFDLSRLQRKRVGHSLKVDAPKVKVAVFYESLCPFCMQVLTKSLYPNFASKGLDKIIDLELVPYGNAHETKTETGEYKFTCQHGDYECVGNVLETCAIAHYPDTATHFAFINCMESADFPPFAAENCSLELGLDYDKIVVCANGKEGNELEHQMAVRTESLEPEHQWVPWITINGVHEEDYDNDPVSAICHAYTGEKPEACMTLHVSLYYESYCPGCRHLITQELYPAWKHQGLDKIILLDMLPYGNTKHVNGSYECQHGELECQVDVYEGCAILQELPNYMDFIYCVESAEEPVDAVKKCAVKMGYDYEKDIAQCAKYSDYVQSYFGNITKALDPPHLYVPWVTIEGNHDKNYEDDVVSYICNLYKGSQKVEACAGSAPKNSGKKSASAAHKQRKARKVTRRSVHHRHSWEPVF